MLRGVASRWGEAHDARGVMVQWGGWWGGVREDRGSWCELLEGGCSLGQSQRRQRVLGWGQVEVLV